MNEQVKEMILLLTGFAAGAVTFGYAGTSLLNEQKSKAVEHGAAEWVVDQKTGETTFHWKGEP